MQRRADDATKTVVTTDNKVPLSVLAVTLMLSIPSIMTASPVLAQSSGSPQPLISISYVGLVPGHTAYLQWHVDNIGESDAWVAPYAGLYAQAATAPYYAKHGAAFGFYALNATGLFSLVPYGGYGWVNVPAHTSVIVYSQAVVSQDVRWAVYNAQLFYDGAFRGWLRPSWDQYVTVRDHSEPPTKYVIFRSDDPRPGVAAGVLKLVNDVHITKNVPVTLGIIPHPYADGTGNALAADSGFSTYMQSLASNQLFEFAQHGWTHRDVTGTASKSEFYGVPYDTQYAEIRTGRDQMTATLGVTPTTFIPPFDRSDVNTLKVTRALGFTHYSTEVSDFNINHGTKEGMQIDAVSLFFDQETLQSLKDKTANLLNQPQTGDTTIVVLYHYWKFTGSGGVVDTGKLTMLSDYIDYLRQRGDVTFTTFDRSYTGR